MDTDTDEGRPQQFREKYVAYLMLVLVGLPLFVFFNVITGGLLIWMLEIAAGLGALAAIHYLLWGRSLNRTVASERESQPEGEPLSADDWTSEIPTGPKQYGPF
jgi:hypothetical protein